MNSLRFSDPSRRSSQDDSENDSFYDAMLEQPFITDEPGRSMDDIRSAESTQQLPGMAAARHSA